MRTNLRIIAFCHNCGEPLEWTTDKPDPSPRPRCVASGGAFEAQLQVWVIPCRTCRKRSEAPMRALQEALRLAKDLDKESP